MRVLSIAHFYTNYVIELTAPMTGVEFQFLINIFIEGDKHSRGPTFATFFFCVGFDIEVLWTIEIKKMVNNNCLTIIFLFVLVF